MTFEANYAGPILCGLQTASRNDVGRYLSSVFLLFAWFLCVLQRTMCLLECLTRNEHYRTVVWLYLHEYENCAWLLSCLGLTGVKFLFMLLTYACSAVSVFVLLFMLS